MNRLVSLLMLVVVLVVSSVSAFAATPPGAFDRVTVRKLIKTTRLARGTVAHTPWVYVFGARFVEFQPDCYGTTAPSDSGVSIQFTDDTTATCRDSVTAGDSTFVIDRVSNTLLVGPRTTMTLTRGSAKRWAALPLTLSAGSAGGAQGGGGGWFGVRWARFALRVGANGTGNYLGCDSLTVRSTVLRDGVSGVADY